MNKMKEVAKVLGYEVGEEFNVIYNDGSYSKYNPFKFTETSLVDKDGDDNETVLLHLITGEYKIEKIPFIPKVGEIFYYVVDGRICPKANDLHLFDKMCIKLGNCFKSEEDAEQNKEKIKEILK